MLLLSGRVTYAVEDQRYDLRPWDILLVRHHAIHKALIDVSEPYERVILYLNGRYIDRASPETRLMTCFDRADARRRYRAVPAPEERQAMSALLLQIESSMSDTAFGSRVVCDALLMQFLVLVNRAAQRGESAFAPDRQDEKLTQIITYINEHLFEPLTVEHLAEQAYLSKYHFMRRFKEQTGGTVHAYILQRRLVTAARLIRSGVPVGKVALDCGFSDYSTFYRAFRRTFGASPGDIK